MELIAKLGIDLKLLLAQIVNFLILFFVLKKLVYKPLLGLMDKRKKMIEQNVEDTKKIEERLTKLEEEKKEILKKASTEAIEIVTEAKKSAEQDHANAMTKAKEEISALAERYRAGLREEKEALTEEIKADMANLIVESSKKIMQKEFSKEDQKRLEGAINQELKSVK